MTKRRRNRFDKRTKPITPGGARLREARERAKMPRVAVATKLSVDPSTILRWEYGDLRPDLDHLAKLAAVYGTTVSVLVGEKPAGEKPARSATGTEG